MSPAASGERSALRSALLVVVPVGAALFGCAGGAPLMHPAHTLPQSAVTFAAGTSGKLALGGLADAEQRVDDASATPGGASSADERRAFVAGALARFAVAPGLAPFVAGRIGLGDQNEAGLTYTARTFRLDGRHAFEWPNVALSLGLAGSLALSRAGDKPTYDVTAANGGYRDVEVSSLTGYGLELPVLFGYRSAADVVMVWGGLRAGFERDSFDALLVTSPQTLVGTSGNALRLWGGGLVGFAVGLPPIQVRTELNAAYESASGHLLTDGGELEADVAGWSLTPALAISAKF